MNYLAHLRLSPSDAESMVGNLMGDFRKYLGKEDLPDAVKRGIENHLRVDKFTDSNEHILNLKGLFSPQRRRFAGIIIDVAFDYYLTRHWQTFSPVNLDDFIDKSHFNIQSMSKIMPERMQYVMDYMIKEQWLRSYASLDGISEVLNRMSARIRFDNNLAGAIEEVETNYDALDQAFLLFFPQLIDHVESNQ
jgi:acyl carrier protein phosphodiesterase